MRMLRIFFDKTGEASYISHLDLQRVMARALRKSGLPVWYSQGFNPHIYMSFSLPLPLGQESFSESVDCKSETEGDLSCYLPALKEALPRGIVPKCITEPKFKSDAIKWAEYQVFYEVDAKIIAQAIQCFEEKDSAKVCLKRKKTEEEIDLKQRIKCLELTQDKSIRTVLPAGNEGGINPKLLLNFLESDCSLPQKGVRIQRLRVLMENEADYC